jgi:hypothetical protein
MIAHHTTPGKLTFDWPVKVVTTAADRFVRAFEEQGGHGQNHVLTPLLASESSLLQTL